MWSLVKERNHIYGATHAAMDRPRNLTHSLSLSPQDSPEIGKLHSDTSGVTIQCAHPVNSRILTAAPERRHCYCLNLQVWMWRLREVSDLSKITQMLRVRARIKTHHCSPKSQPLHVRFCMACGKGICSHSWWEAKQDMSPCTFLYIIMCLKGFIVL